MTQLADRLERAQLVSRVAEAGDRRVRCLQLTQRGAKIMREHRESRIERIAALLGKLSPAQRTAAIHALQAMWEAAQDSDTGDAPSTAVAGLNKVEASL